MSCRRGTGGLRRPSASSGEDGWPGRRWSLRRRRSADDPGLGCSTSLGLPAALVSSGPGLRPPGPCVRPSGPRVGSSGPDPRLLGPRVGFSGSCPGLSASGLGLPGTRVGFSALDARSSKRAFEASGPESGASKPAVVPGTLGRSVRTARSLIAAVRARLKAAYRHPQEHEWLACRVRDHSPWLGRAQFCNLYRITVDYGSYLPYMSSTNPV